MLTQFISLRIIKTLYPIARQNHYVSLLWTSFSEQYVNTNLKQTILKIQLCSSLSVDDQRGGGEDTSTGGDAALESG